MSDLYECASCDWVLEPEETHQVSGRHYCPTCGTEMQPKGVFKALPAFALKPEYGEKRARVLKFFQEHAGEWHTSKAIAQACGYSTEDTRVALRYAITELQLEFNTPIVSGAKGFRLARTPGEVKAFIRKLEARKEGITRKQVAMQEAARRMEEVSVLA